MIDDPIGRTHAETTRIAEKMWRRLDRKGKSLVGQFQQIITQIYNPATGGIHEPALPGGSVATHEDAADPHPQYATDTDLSTHAAGADPHTGYVLESLLDAKGDIYAASADNTPARVAVGTNGYVLTADSTAPAGVAWAVSAGGGPGTSRWELLVDGTLDGWVWAESGGVFTPIYVEVPL